MAETPSNLNTVSLTSTSNEPNNHVGNSSEVNTSQLPARPHATIPPYTEATAYSKSSSLLIPPPSLATSRYNRQLLIPSLSLSGQQRISETKILIVGLGGLGSPCALYLAGAGPHTLGLLDSDVVETSNLHRQIIHRESSVQNGMSKVNSALRACRELNSEVNYVGHEVRLSGGVGDNAGGKKALEVIDKYDIVLDCTDNPATRYLISDCCVLLGKTLVSGAAQKLEGQVVVLNCPISIGTASEAATSKEASPQPSPTAENKEAKRGPCYRCIFPTPPSPDLVRGCSEIGILGPVVGTIGCIMASETLRLIVQQSQPEPQERKPTMLLYNAWSTDPKGMFRTIGLRSRRSDCVVCGDSVTLKEKRKKRITKRDVERGTMDYIAFCGVVEDIKVLDEEKERITAKDFVKKMQEPNETKETNTVGVVVDVREEFEIELGMKIKGSINIPISRILQSNNNNNNKYISNSSHPSAATPPESQNELPPADDLDNLLQKTPAGSPIYFICQRGNDSQLAAKKLLDREKARRKREIATPSLDFVAAGTGPNRSKKEGGVRWIGDVKGGFMDLEKLL